MIFTIRLQNDRNVEFQLDTTQRILYIIDPIPDISIEQLLLELKDKNYTSVSIVMYKKYSEGTVKSISTNNLMQDYAEKNNENNNDGYPSHKNQLHNVLKIQTFIPLLNPKIHKNIH